METDSQRQELMGWWQRRVERVKNYFCPRYVVDPMPPPSWELFGSRRCLHVDWRVWCGSLRQFGEERDRKEQVSRQRGEIF